jgi:uncharacterized protein DUF4019
MTEAFRSTRSKRPGLLRSSFWPRSIVELLLLTFALVLIAGCGLRSESRGVPVEVEAAIASVTDDIAAERYEKIYNEAADLWKAELTLEETVSVFKTLQAKLGKMENRTLHSATEQHNSGGPLKGNAFIVSYQSRFQKGEGMETFTLVERDHQWRLARYFVNSTALK